MRKLIAALLLIGALPCLAERDDVAISSAAHSSPIEGILKTVDNADVTPTEAGFLLRRRNAHLPMKITFAECQGLGIEREQDQWWVLPLSAGDTQVHANSAVWVLPFDAKSKETSWHVELQGGQASAIKTSTGLDVVLDTGSATLSKWEARPHSDPFGHRFSLQVDGGADLEQALAGFYWGTMLPLVVEKTMAAHFAYSNGYVLSTLNTQAYAGSYPAVDHEFQIKGRLAMGSQADLDIVKRMIELQFTLMNDDPERLYRSPTSVQPNGTREYHVRRNSKDNHQNAAMFPLTGSIEVVEEAWHYYEARKDLDWLRSNIANLEHSAGWTLQSMDLYGRIWSDVYYEDQVMKDGRETQAQAFAAYSFGLLAQMEDVLMRKAEADRYAEASKKMADALIRPLPMGYWDERNQRFVDWIDRNSKVHDHIHLLANELPVMFGYATPAQAGAVRRLISEHDGQFQRFPSFLAADIGGYDNSEIGDGGPYDLSAAGRYWYWDAAFRASEEQNDVLLHQLKTVAAEGAKDNYFMGERYDMDYVYYIDGKNAHGAEKYYEYPNVFAAVLIAKYLGLTVPADADLSIAPHLSSYGSVEFENPIYALHYSYDKQGFSLRNLSDRPKHFKVDLSALGSGKAQYRLEHAPGGVAPGTRFTVELPSHGEANWIAER